MANPQKENGYTPIANELLEALISADLSGQEMRIALLIIRKTYGFNKLEDSVSLSQMMVAANLSKIRCSQVINRLQLMKIVTVTENINGIGKKYKFNKDFENWDTVKENCNRYRKTKSTVKVLRNRPLQKTVTTKDTITKDTITKEIVYPDWLPKETFIEFVEMRKKLKKPLLEKSYNRFFNHLKKICNESKSTPEEILNQSILNSWQGIFPLKEKINATGNQGRNFNSYRGNNNNRQLDPDTAAELDRIAESLRSK